MSDFFLIIYLGIPFLFLVLGFVAGKILEGKHYKSIHRRERQTVGLPVVSWRTITDGRTVQSSQLALGAVVISVDHYKRFLMGIRKIFGGEIRAYSSLLDRARREAILRMKENCPGADMILNCRIETSTISSGRGNSTGTVEVIAYGTAVRFGV